MTGVGLETRDSHQFVSHRVSRGAIEGEILRCSLGSIRPDPHDLLILLVLRQVTTI